MAEHAKIWGERLPMMTFLEWLLYSLMSLARYLLSAVKLSLSPADPLKTGSPTLLEVSGSSAGVNFPFVTLGRISLKDSLPVV